MRLVGDFLKKFNTLTPPNDSVKKELVQVLKRVAGVSVTLKQVAVKNGIAYIYSSSVVKSVIQVKRGEVLSALYEQLPKARDTVRDIR